MIMRRKLFYGKESSTMTRKLYFETRSLDYEKEVVLWKRSSMMRRKIDYEKGGLLLERKFYDDKKI